MLLLAVISSSLFISVSRSERGSIEVASKKVDEWNVSGCEQVALLNSVTNGHLEEVSKLVKEGADIHATGCNGFSAMHLAVLNHSKNMVLALLEGRFNLNRVFEGSGTVLDFAINNSFDMVQLLMDLGANINQIFKPKGETYLHRAVRNGDFSLTRILIQLGINLEAADWENNSPLILSIKENHPAIFNLLAASGADTSKGNLLHVAVKNNLTDLLYTLLGRGLAVDGKNEDGYSPIALAVRDDKTATVEILADFNADLQQWNEGESLLDIALQTRSYNCMRFLFNRGLKAQDDSRALMKTAIDRDDVEALKMFNEFGLSLNVSSSIAGNLMQYAAEKGSVQSIRWLSQKGQDVNSTDIYIHGFGVTPLHVAVMFNHLPAVRALVESGSCLTCKDDHGHTPLVYAHNREINDYLRKQMSTLS